MQVGAKAFVGTQLTTAHVTLSVLYCTLQSADHLSTVGLSLPGKRRQGSENNPVGRAHRLTSPHPGARQVTELPLNEEHINCTYEHKINDYIVQLKGSKLPMVTSGNKKHQLCSLQVPLHALHLSSLAVLLKCCGTAGT